MFQYFARLYEKFALPVYPVAVFSFAGPARKEPDEHVVRFPDLDVLQFRFRTIQLNRLDWRDYLKHRNPVAVALMAKMRMSKAERQKVKCECLRLLATLKLDPARTKLISGFVDTYLKLNPQEEKLFRKEIEELEPPEKEAVMEIVTSWMEQGIKQGRKQGIEQGIEQGRKAEAAAFVQRLIHKKFGTLSSEQETVISGLPLSTLEDLGEALFDFATAADLDAWLQARR